jgi:hypothetical protein
MDTFSPVVLVVWCARARRHISSWWLFRVNIRYDNIFYIKHTQTVGAYTHTLSSKIHSRRVHRRSHMCEPHSTFGRDSRAHSSSPCFPNQNNLQPFSPEGKVSFGIRGMRNRLVIGDLSVRNACCDAALIYSRRLLYGMSERAHFCFMRGRKYGAT